jgi:hypothetical protein
VQAVQPLLFRFVIVIVAQIAKAWGTLAMASQESPKSPSRALSATSAGAGAIGRQVRLMLVECSDDGPDMFAEAACLIVGAGARARRGPRAGAFQLDRHVVGNAVGTGNLGFDAEFVDIEENDAS